MLSQIWEDFLLVPDVVSCGQDGDAQPQQLIHQVRRNAETGGRVFAVGENQVWRKFRDQVRQALFHNTPPGASKNVANVQNSDGVLQESPARADTGSIAMTGRENQIFSRGSGTRSDAQTAGFSNRSSVSLYSPTFFSTCCVVVSYLDFI